VAYPEIRPADPGEAGVRALISAHLEYGRAVSPPEDAHVLEPEALGGPGIALFAARDGDAVLAIGAMDAFAPARALYESAGFTPCAPFADYVASENSVYLSLSIAEQ
jgi:putative acetyltransferase